MNAALAAVAFAPGLAIGSFVNVVATRLPLRRSVVHPRSACMSCGSELAWYDNVPLLSYVLLRGRCRSCGVRIGLVYPAVELATALLVAACFVRFGLSGRGARARGADSVTAEPGMGARGPWRRAVPLRRCACLSGRHGYG